MRGYTAKKGDRYYAVIYEGIDPITGKERRRWYAAGPRKADAERMVTDLVKRRNDGDLYCLSISANKAGVIASRRHSPTQISSLDVIVRTP